MPEYVICDSVCAAVISNKAVCFETVIPQSPVIRGNDCILFSLSPSPALGMGVTEAAGLSRPDSGDEPQ